MAQDAADEWCQQQLQRQRQNLRVHVDATIGQRQGEIRALRAKFYLNPKDKVKAILGQVLAYLILVVEFSGPWIEIHANSGSKLGSLPFLLCHDLALARAADSAKLASLRHL